MRSKAFASNGVVQLHLAVSPNGAQIQCCVFDSIEVAEELAYDILNACDAARGQKPLALGELPDSC